MAEFELSLDGEGQSLRDLLGDLESGTTVRVAISRSPDNIVPENFPFNPSEYPEIEFEVLLPTNRNVLTSDDSTEFTGISNVAVRVVWLNFSSFEATHPYTLPNIIWAPRDTDGFDELGDSNGRYVVAMFTDTSPPLSDSQRNVSSLSLRELHTSVHSSTLEELSEFWTDAWQSGFAPINYPVSVEGARFYWVEVESVQGGGETQVEIPRRHMPFFTREHEQYGEGDKVTVIMETAGETDYERSVRIHTNKMCRPNLAKEVTRYDLTDYSVLFRYMGTDTDPQGNEKPKFTVNIIPDEKEALVEPFRNACRSREQLHEMAPNNRKTAWL